MTKTFELSLEKDAVRFTPSGEIAVIDAIKALSKSDCAAKIWQQLKDENPQILSHCRQFYFSKDSATTVADGQGWEEIEALLFDYILDHDYVSC